MSHLKAKPPIGGEPISGSGIEAGAYSTPKFTTKKCRCLSPTESALIKLDSIEMKLQAARAAGDDDAWSRYYLAWLALHSLAFGYGKWSRGVSDGNL